MKKILLLIIVIIPSAVIGQIDSILVTQTLGGARITWVDDPGKAGVEIYRSANGGVYSMISRVPQNTETYSDLTEAGSYKYKLKSYTGKSFSALKSAAPEYIEFLFESTGDGSGLGIFNLWPTENTTMKITGGYFYDDLNGTQNERTTELLIAGQLNPVYIKVPYGTASLKVKNVIYKWGDDNTGTSELLDGWNTHIYDADSGTNCPRVVVDVSKMTYNTSINVFGLNRIYGDLTGNTIMTYMEIADGTNAHVSPGNGGATCGGDISTMTELTVLDVWDDTEFYGNVTNLTKMKLYWLGGYTDLTGDVTTHTSCVGIIAYPSATVNFSGTLNNMPNLATLQVYNLGSVTGTSSVLTKLRQLELYGSNNITIDNFTNLKNLSSVNIRNNVLSSATVNQLLADIWLNRNESKTLSTRVIDIYGAAGSGAPTGQGITDKTNLQNYRTPNNNASYDLWTITTR